MIEEDISTYKRRLLVGESCLSAKQGLKIFEEIEIDDMIYVGAPIKERVQSDKLTRKTILKCPICSGDLYNVRLDGSYFYCKKCEAHYHLRTIDVPPIYYVVQGTGKDSRIFFPEFTDM